MQNRLPAAVREEKNVDTLKGRAPLTHSGGKNRKVSALQTRRLRFIVRIEEDGDFSSDFNEFKLFRSVRRRGTDA